jgi:hypothetical protein
MQIDSWVMLFHIVILLLTILVASTFYCSWFEEDKSEPWWKMVPQRGYEPVTDTRHLSTFDE